MEASAPPPGLCFYRESTWEVQIKYNLPSAYAASEPEGPVYYPEKVSAGRRTRSHARLSHKAVLCSSIGFPGPHVANHGISILAFWARPGIFIRAWARHLLMMSEEMRNASSMTDKICSVAEYVGRWWDEVPVQCCEHTIESRRQRWRGACAMLWTHHRVKKAEMPEEAEVWKGFSNGSDTIFISCFVIKYLHTNRFHVHFHFNPVKIHDILLH